MITHIYTTLGGAKQYVGGTVHARFGDDISGATFEVGLSTSRSTPPTGWTTPSINTQGETVSDRLVKLLVDETTPPGKYTLWVRVTDFPEVEPMVLHPNIEVI